MREYIKAGEGKILTNGEVYGKKIYLAEGMDKRTFYEITKEAYEQKLEEGRRRESGEIPA